MAIVYGVEGDLFSIIRNILEKSQGVNQGNLKAHD